MRSSRTLVILSWLIAALALLAAVGGLLWPGGDRTFMFTTLRGETVEIYGRGLYRYDSLLVGSGFRGTDTVVLFLAIPLLIFSTLRYLRGSLQGTLLLMGVLAYFLYNYASMALGAAYNELFLIYVALVSASLFAFVLSFSAIDQERLSARVEAHMPHRGLAIFMFAASMVFLVVWLGLAILPSLLQGRPPQELSAYTTLVTHVLDLGILMPASFLAGVLLLRRATLGYLLAFTMLTLAIFVVGLSVPAATMSQLVAGYAFTTGQFVAFVVSFFVLGLIATWLAVVFLRNIEDEQ